jgi:hypothetical protein
MATQQVVPVACPNCNTQFNAPIQTIINGQDPAQKNAFLQGAFNVTQCPQCGFTSPLGVPLLYYDLEKEFALVLMPEGVQMPQPEQQKVIGELTNNLVNSLPAEDRKFYLFNPQQFLTMESMVKAILKAEGVTEEMMEMQAAKAKLIQEFLQVQDEKTLKDLVKKHDAELDKDFFEVLTASMEAAQMEGQQATLQTLFALRGLLVEFSTQGKQAVKEIDEEMGEMYLKTQDELLERLLAAKDDKEFEALVVTGFSLLDYGFFQKLTAQIDAAVKAKDTAKENALSDVRAKVLEVKTKYEEASRAALEDSMELLREIMQSDNPEKVIDNNLDRIGEPFFAILSANLQEAQKEKQEDAVKALQIIGNIAMSKLQVRANAKAEVKETAQAASQIHLP